MWWYLEVKPLVIMFWWSPESGALIMGLVCLFLSCSLSLSPFFSVRIQQEISLLEARKRLYQNPIMLALWSQTPSLQICEKSMSVTEATQSMVFCPSNPSRPRNGLSPSLKYWKSVHSKNILQMGQCSPYLFPDGTSAEPYWWAGQKEVVCVCWVMRAHGL